MKGTIIILVIGFYLNAFGQDRRLCSAKSGSKKISETYTLYSSSGDQYIDQITNQELYRLQNSFLVAPIFFFYDDKDGKNAKATDEVTNPRGPDGTVIFGARLFRREYVRSYGSTTIPIIIAHEYAHIVDFKYGVLEHVTGKEREIFADVFAGMYIFVRDISGVYTDLNAVMDCFESLADTDFGTDEHGSALERTEAVNHGYQFMRENAARGVYVNLSMAMDEAKDYSEQFSDDDEDDDDK